MAINTLYLDTGVLKSAGKVYNNQTPKNIRLEKFFQPSVFSMLQKKLHNEIYKLKFHPYKYKYSTAKSKEIDSFLNGRYFFLLAEKIIGIKNYKTKYEIRKFENGDYTLLHDAEKEKSGVDFIIDFSKTSKTFGGHAVYLTESEELLHLSPFPNSVSFVERKQGLMKYTKYFTHQNTFPIVQVVGSIYKKDVHSINLPKLNK